MKGKGGKERAWRGKGENATYLGPYLAIKERVCLLILTVLVESEPL